MTRIIAGDRSASAELAETVANGSTTRIWSVDTQPGDADPSSSATLARALIEFEADTEGQEIESVLLADASDAALAAALVATKLQIAVTATATASDPSTANGRLIAQLAAS